MRDAPPAVDATSFRSAAWDCVRTVSRLGFIVNIAMFGFAIRGKGDGLSEVLHERLEGGILLLRINRPEAKNALNQEVRRLLAEHCAAANTDDSVKAIVLTGNEEAFVAGADIKVMAEA